MTNITKINLNEQPLPADVATERMVCAALMVAPRLLADCWPVLSEGVVFTSPAYKAVAIGIFKLYSEGQSVRPLNLIKLMKTEGSYRHLVNERVDLSGMQTDGMVSSECMINCLYLREQWIRRQGIEGIEQLRKLASSPMHSVDELTAYASTLADNLTSGMSIASVKTFGHYVKSAFGQIEAAMQKPGGLTGVPTGLDKLNRHFGGWQNGIIMIAGRPGMGKTVVGLSLALSAARAGIPTAYFSLEVSGEDLVMRSMAEAALIPYEDVMRGRLSTAQFQSLHAIAGELEQLPVFIYDDEARDIADVRNAMIDLVRTHKVGFVVIDYVQLIEDKTSRGKEYDEQTNISKKLKKLQRRLNIPLVELAQLSRDVEKRPSRRPNKTDLRSTGQYEQDASVVILLYRDDYYKAERAKENNEPDPVMDYEIEFIVDKNRNGKTGVAVLFVDVATNRLLDHSPVSVQPVPPFKPQLFPENIKVPF